MSFETINDLTNHYSAFTVISNREVYMFNVGQCEVCGCPTQEANATTIDMEEKILGLFIALLRHNEITTEYTEIPDEIFYCEALGCCTCNQCWKEDE